MGYSFEYTSARLKGIIEPIIQSSHRLDIPLGIRKFSDAYVAPFVGWEKSIGCVIDKEGQAIKDSECLEWKENEVFYDFNDCDNEQKKVVFLGFLLTIFGHSYTDDLRKLWFLKTKECQTLVKKGYTFVYTTSWNNPIPEAVMAIFLLAGIDLINAKHITRLTHFDEIIIPDNSYRATDIGRVYCPEFTSLINNIKSSVPDSCVSIPKVYFTRTKFTNGSKKEIGERKIERVFHKLGYEIIIPEEHPVVEQIQIVRNCDYFAATEGSISHLSLFCKPKTNVVILNKANYVNFHQVMINEYADLNVTYIEAHHSSKANKKYPWWGPFYLCINKYLERYVGHYIPHLPYWICFSYWEYSRNLIYRCYNRSKKVLREAIHFHNHSHI